ncbi:Smr/MutS family protein [Alphaproteobacteria bacterium]|nr:Smr/MutS family protein [Alphaproteobacteria bacterium]
MSKKDKRFPAQRPNTDDDETVWRAVTKTVTAYHKDIALPQRKTSYISAQPSPPKPDEKSASALASRAKKTSGVFPALPKTYMPLQPADFRQGDYAGIDSSNARRLRQGRMDIDDIIDLHGMTQAEAQTRLRSFIQRAAFSGNRTVLIITGKGRAGQGILRARVPEWLKEPPLSQLVIAISDAQPGDGGTGALYVRLKRKSRQ